MIDPMPDDELIQDLKHWGESEHSVADCKAQSILRHVAEKRQSNVRLVLVIGACMATAITSGTWLVGRKSKPSLPFEVAIEPFPEEQDPEQLLQSIASRSQDVVRRAEGLQSRLLEQQRSAKELEAIHSQILHFKRAAVRNQIALSQ